MVKQFIVVILGLKHDVTKNYNVNSVKCVGI